MLLASVTMARISEGGAVVWFPSGIVTMTYGFGRPWEHQRLMLFVAVEDKMAVREHFDDKWGSTSFSTYDIAHTAFILGYRSAAHHLDPDGMKVEHSAQAERSVLYD